MITGKYSSPTMSQRLLTTYYTDRLIEKQNEHAYVLQITKLLSLLPNYVYYQHKRRY